MDEIPESIEIAGADFDRVEAPEGLACWTAEVSTRWGRSPVSLVIEPAASPDARVVRAAEEVVGEFDERVDVASAYLREQLRLPEYQLAPHERALLDAPRPPYDGPEAVVWPDGTSMVRFAHSSLSIAEELGIGVRFNGAVPDGVEVLTDAEPVDDF